VAPRSKLVAAAARRSRLALAWLSALATACVGLTTLQAAAANVKKRTPPNYDGRGGPPQSPARKALWAPRILFAPAYFVTEYLIRRPLGFAITAAEKAQLPRVLYDLFATGPQNVGVVPFVLVDFGFEPSVGLYAYWDDVGFKGHELRLRGSTWGPHWLSGTATERFHPTRQLELTLTSTATRRPDYAFYGIGPNARETDLVRYASDSVDTSFETRFMFAGRSLLEVASGYRGVTFGPTDYDEASLTDAVRAGKLSEPPGFREGYRAGILRARLVLDSRGHSSSQTGTRLELTAEQGMGGHGDASNNQLAPGWLRYRATLGGFLGLSRGGRLFSVSISAQLAEPLGSRFVPFTELAALGGGTYLSGFRSGRLRDRSSLVATVRYSWPIWLWLRGSVQGAVGNVFGERFDGADPRLARASLAIGMEGYRSQDSVLQALVGVGTETFESGAKLNSARIVIGARRGF
jgi:hypothetical protein